MDHPPGESAMALIMRFLIVDPFDVVLAVKYDREGAIESLKEWRASGHPYALICETSLLSRPEFRYARIMIGFNDPITQIN